MSKLSSLQFENEDAAIKHFESIVWPNGPRCPHCGGTERLTRLRGKSVRAGSWKCYKCRKQFTAKVGTFFEYSHLPMTKWLQIVYLMASSAQDIPAYRLHRVLEVQYNTAWFIARHLRKAKAELHVDRTEADGGPTRKTRPLRKDESQYEEANKTIKGQEAQLAKFRAAACELAHEGSRNSYDSLLRKVAQQKPILRRAPRKLLKKGV